jgi:hypothetical protein
VTEISGGAQLGGRSRDGGRLRVATGSTIDLREKAPNQKLESMIRVKSDHL